MELWYMSKMYSRSFVMITQAKDALKKVSEDDAYLDIACFETQEKNQQLT